MLLSPDRCRQRLTRLISLCEEQRLDLAVIADTKHIAYLTGFLRPDIGVAPMKVVLLLVYPEAGPVLLVSQGFKADAEKTYRDEMVVYVDYDIHQKMVTHLEDALAVLRERLVSQKRPLRTIGVEGRALPSAAAALFTQLYPSAKITDISTVIPSMRRIKDDDELALIRRSEAKIALAYRTVKQAIGEGRTELDAYLAGEAALVREVGGLTFFAGDFASGERSVGIGGWPTGRVLKAGDLFIFDLWTTTTGYWADTCRTFVVGGSPTAEHTRLHEAVLSAIDAGEQLLRPGTSARDVYQAMAEAFEARGLGDRFPHHGGHGIGLYAHEAPFFIPASEEVLEEGMVCTLEPGVYLPGIGGVRSEDNYLITATGFENLTPYPRGLA